MKFGLILIIGGIFLIILGCLSLKVENENKKLKEDLNNSWMKSKEDQLKNEFKEKLIDQIMEGTPSIMKQNK